MITTIKNPHLTRDEYAKLLNEIYDHYQKNDLSLEAFVDYSSRVVEFQSAVNDPLINEWANWLLSNILEQLTEGKKQ